VTARFDPERLLEVLTRHGVEFVLIGGLVSAVHGSPLPTADVDITPRVATLRAIIRSKETADREKDRRALPYLKALLEETGG